MHHILERYIPEKAISEILTLQDNYSFKLIIAKKRKTKLGDFRPAKNNIHRISVNGNLSKYEFLIVLLHEIAHLIVWNKYHRKVKPHGVEWKNTFNNLILSYVDLGVFTEQIKAIILKCIKKNIVSTIKCEELARVLNIELNNRNVIFLKDIPNQSLFELKVGKKFIKMHKIKTRYKCKEILSGRIYTIHPLAEVVSYKVV
ncbi:MAG: SprT family zinc-dependent metalloprotease [Chlorobi bacterium]|nr:SprT family zinc-dependent metalloprotease [Chlorobiota bacterium]